MEVFVWNDIKGQIGAGATDADGVYLINWSYSGTLTAEQRAKTRVWVRPWQKDRIFRLNKPDGDDQDNWSGYFTLELGTTQQNPQVRPTLCPYSCSNSSDHYNAYWAAERTWRIRLASSGWFGNYF